MLYFNKLLWVLEQMNTFFQDCQWCRGGWRREESGLRPFSTIFFRHKHLTMMLFMSTRNTIWEVFHADRISFEQNLYTTIDHILGFLLLPLSSTSLQSSYGTVTREYNVQKTSLFTPKLNSTWPSKAKHIWSTWPDVRTGTVKVTYDLQNQQDSRLTIFNVAVLVGPVTTFFLNTVPWTGTWAKFRTHWWTLTLECLIYSYPMQNFSLYSWITWQCFQLVISMALVANCRHLLL